MKLRANLPFQLQSFYQGFPPASTAMFGKRFSWFLLGQQSPKLFLIAKSPNHGEKMLSRLAEK